MKMSDRAYLHSINAAKGKNGSLNVRVHSHFGYIAADEIIEDKANANFALLMMQKQMPVFLFHNFDSPAYRIGSEFVGMYPSYQKKIITPATPLDWCFYGTYINGGSALWIASKDSFTNPLVTVDSFPFFNTISEKGDIIQLYYRPYNGAPEIGFWCAIIYHIEMGSYSSILEETNFFIFDVFDTLIESDNILQYNNTLNLVTSTPDGKYHCDNLNPLAYKKVTTADSQNFIRINKPYPIIRHTGIISKIDWLSTFINFQFNYKY
jgi:hypothetical protein